MKQGDTEAINIKILQCEMCTFLKNKLLPNMRDPAFIRILKVERNI